MLFATDQLLSDEPMPLAPLSAIVQVVSDTDTSSASIDATGFHLSEIAFVDSAIANHESLAADIRAQATSGRNIEVHVLSSATSGIEQISDLLAARQSVGALHIFAAGADGQVALGGGTLEFQSLLNSTSQIKSWREALSRDAEVLPYGNGFAKRSESDALVDALARLTGAEVRIGSEPAEQSDSLSNAGSSPWASAREPHESVVVAPTPLADQTRREVVFVSATVQDYSRLVDGIDAAAEFHILAAEQDGIKQMAAILAGRSSIDAVHIISHGAAGELQLGTAQLNLASMTGRYVHDLDAIRQALSAEADMLIYGCDVAAGEGGVQFIARLSQLTGADVAASTDLTGAATDGGDWDLEERAGRVETATLAAIGWGGTLGSVPTGITPLRSETRVNTTTTNAQTLTPYGGGNVAMDSNGNYVVVWNDANTGSGDIYFQRYNAAGVAQGSNTLVNTFTTNLQNDANVAMDSVGNFVVVWASTNQDGSATGIYAQRYNASGVAQGSEFQVNTTTNGNQDSPSVGMASDGSFVISFTDYNSIAGDIYIQRYSAAGTAQGGNVRVNSTTPNVQECGSVAVSSNGDFVVAWESEAQDGTLDGVYAQRYNAAGVAQGGEFRANTTVSGDEQNVAVAIDSTGNFVIVWDASTADPGGNTGVYAQRYNAAGVAQGGEFRVNTTTADTQALAAVAMNAEETLSSPGTATYGTAADTASTPSSTIVLAMPLATKLGSTRRRPMRSNIPLWPGWTARPSSSGPATAPGTRGHVLPAGNGGQRVAGHQLVWRTDHQRGHESRVLYGRRQRHHDQRGRCRGRHAGSHAHGHRRHAHARRHCGLDFRQRRRRG